MLLLKLHSHVRAIAFQLLVHKFYLLFLLLLSLLLQIKQIIQCKTCVVFVLDEESDELVCEVRESKFLSMLSCM